MFAAQEGLVDLDEPITTYLPDFRVNSIFEEHPEQKMTLRILLSHTAGVNVSGFPGYPADPFSEESWSCSCLSSRGCST